MNFDIIVGRNTLTGRSDKRALVKRCYTLLADNGSISIAEVIPSKTTRLSSLQELQPLGDELLSVIREIEAVLYHSPDNPLVNWSEEHLHSMFREEGFREITGKIKTYSEERFIREKDIVKWFGTDAGEKTGYGVSLKKVLTEKEFDHTVSLIKNSLAEKSVQWVHTVVFLSAKK